MRIRSGLVAVLSAGLLAVSLAPVASAQSPAPNGLAGSGWVLGAVGGSPVASGVNANLIFADADAGGFGGCNRFFGGYTTDGASTLVFGPLASTKMACDDATNAFETSYLTALASVATYAITDAGLDLSDAAGTVVLSFGAEAPASVEGPWIIGSFNNGNQGVETVPDGMNATVAFGPEGNVEGFGGCNNFFGGYSVDGDAIAIGPLMSTMMACDKATNTFEAQLLAALQNATVWSLNAGTLELRDADGALQVDATSAIGN